MSGIWTPQLLILRYVNCFFNEKLTVAMILAESHGLSWEHITIVRDVPSNRRDAGTCNDNAEKDTDYNISGNISSN
jgi:hypothetical protein